MANKYLLKLWRHVPGFSVPNCLCGKQRAYDGNPVVYVCNDCHTPTNYPADHDCEVAYREREALSR